jgi:hypothetical protein
MGNCVTTHQVRQFSVDIYFLLAFRGSTFVLDKFLTRHEK